MSARKFAMGLPFEAAELAVDGFSHLPYFSYGLANWVVIPGLALLLGATPFLRKQETETGSLKSEV